MDIQFLGLIIVSLVLAVVLAAYERLMRKFQGMRATRAEIEEKAREKATKMIEEARDKAVLILNQANLESAGNQEELNKRLQEAALKQVDIYKEMLQNISKSIESGAMGEIADFKSILEKQTVGVEQSVAVKIDQQLQEANKQIEDYKTAKIREFEARAEDVAREFCRLAGIKSLTLEEHPELIKQALEEAKKANVL